MSRNSVCNSFACIIPWYYISFEWKPWETRRQEEDTLVSQSRLLWHNSKCHIMGDKCSPRIPLKPSRQGTGSTRTHSNLKNKQRCTSGVVQTLEWLDNTKEKHRTEEGDKTFNPRMWLNYDIDSYKYWHSQSSRANCCPSLPRVVLPSVGSDRWWTMNLSTQKAKAKAYWYMTCRGLIY